jgi:hypothetical protein
MKGALILETVHEGSYVFAVFAWGNPKGRGEVLRGDIIIFWDSLYRGTNQCPLHVWGEVKREHANICNFIKTRNYLLKKHAKFL